MDLSVVAASVIVLAVASAVHALLYKRDSRAVIAWVAFIIMVPLAGAIMYWLLGVNRIRRRAGALRPCPAGHPYTPAGQSCEPDDAFTPLAAVTDRVSPFPLVAGNRVEPLVNGDAAYPAMLEAIDGARRCITLATYIFDADDAGSRFADALAAAAGRGVEVRVLIDGVGARYSRRSMPRMLRARGVDCRTFLPVHAPLTFASINMRNHRKLLVVDGATGFTGGMNLRAGNLLATTPPDPVQDLHLKLTGPVVAQLQRVFADDWVFAGGGRLEGTPWFPALEPTGDVRARGLPGGPDGHIDVLRLVRSGALAVARSSVIVVTPYFLPDSTLISALVGASLRGVSVDILVPSRNNIPLVKWASAAQYWQVLEHGCRVWETPPPFDHSKLLLVDDAWALVGSANWDPRSLRLNFEFELECHGAALGQVLRAWADAKRATAHEVTLAQADARSLPVRLRDGAARLFTPYL